MILLLDHSFELFIQPGPQAMEASIILDPDKKVIWACTSDYTEADHVQRIYLMWMKDSHGSKRTT